MAINRLMTPAEIPMVQPFQLPYNEIAQGLMSAQQQQDQATTLIGDIEDTTFNYITEHDALAQGILADIRGSVDDLVRRSGNGDMRHLSSDIKKLARQTGRRFSPDGDIGKLQRVYAAKQAWLERQRKNDKIDQDFLTGALRTLSGNTVADFSDPNFDLYSSAPELVNAFDFNEWGNTYGKDIEAKIIETARTHAMSEDGSLLPYLTTVESASEYLGEDRIRKILYDYAGSNRHMQQYLQQGIQFGVFDEAGALGLLNNTINAAANKYKINNTKSATRLSNNALFTKLLDAEANEGVAHHKGLAIANEAIGFQGDMQFQNGKVVANRPGLPPGISAVDAWLYANDPETFGQELSPEQQAVYDRRIQRANDYNVQLEALKSSNPAYANMSLEDIHNSLATAVDNSLGSYNQGQISSLFENSDMDKFFGAMNNHIIDGKGLMSKDVDVIFPDGTKTTENVGATLKQLGLFDGNGNPTRWTNKRYGSTTGGRKITMEDYIEDQLKITSFETSDPWNAGTFVAQIETPKGFVSLAIDGTDEMMATYDPIQRVGQAISNPESRLQMAQGNPVDIKYSDSSILRVSIETADGINYIPLIQSMTTKDGKVVENGKPHTFEQMVDKVTTSFIDNMIGTQKSRLLKALQ